MKRLLIAVLISTAIGCSRAPYDVLIAFSAADESAIIAIEDGAKLDAYAYDAGERMNTPLLRRVDHFDGSNPLRITVLYFTQPLDALKIPHGLLPTITDGLDPRSLSAFREADEAAVTGSGVSAFKKVDVVSDRVRMIEVPFANPCKVLLPKRFELGGEPYTAGLVALSSTSALTVAYENGGAGTFYTIDANGPHSLGVRIPTLSPIDMAKSADGRIFITGLSLTTGLGSTWAGTLEDGFVELPPLPGPMGGLQIRGLDGARSGEPPSTVYAMGVSGRLYRFAAGSWSNIGALDRTYSASIGILAWNAPADFFVVAPDQMDIFHFANGRVSREMTPLGEMSHGDLFEGLRVVPGFGVVAGTQNGYVFMRDPVMGTWSSLNGQPVILENAVYALEPYGTGFVYGAETGIVQQFYPQLLSTNLKGFCMENTFLGTDVAVNLIVRMTGGFIVAGVEQPTATSRRIYVATLTEM